MTSARCFNGVYETVGLPIREQVTLLLGKMLARGDGHFLERNLEGFLTAGYDGSDFYD
jgi:hypothetical protein